MGEDQKDRLGRTLRDREKGEEDRYFAERDRELLRKLREKLAGTAASGASTAAGGAQWRCPTCGSRGIEPPSGTDPPGECPACRVVS
jgi:rubrerythrin